MLIKIKKNGILDYKKFQFKCAFGKAGIKKNKREGDMASPKGTYSLGKIYYRADRIKKRKTNLKWTIIRKYMGWCNDPKDKSYNKQIDLRSKKRGEKCFKLRVIYLQQN